MGILIALHVLICILLIALVLIQSGRGGGLVENFSGVESIFGSKTNAFMTRTTTVLSILFFLTCLTLALLSVKQSRSLMRQLKTQAPAANATQEAKTAPVPAEQAQPAANSTK